jgi:hypothetical protein
LKDTVSRVEHHRNIRIVVKFPQSRGKARAYRGPLSIPRRCPLSAVKQQCSSASPGLNRVFGLLPTGEPSLRASSGEVASGVVVGAAEPAAGALGVEGAQQHPRHGRCCHRKNHSGQRQ